MYVAAGVAMAESRVSSLRVFCFYSLTSQPHGAATLFPRGVGISNGVSQQGGMGMA